MRQNLTKKEIINSIYMQLGYSKNLIENIIEDIFDLWAYNYNNEILWKKYIGVLNFRKKFNINNNNFINKGLKGETYEFAMKLEELLSFRSTNLPFSLVRKNELMW